jgi:hypothetical protein
VFTVASKITHLLRRYPVVLALLLVVLSMLGARFGHPGLGGHPGFGLWDGPI